MATKQLEDSRAQSKALSSYNNCGRAGFKTFHCILPRCGSMMGSRPCLLDAPNVIISTLVDNDELPLYGAMTSSIRDVWNAFRRFGIGWLAAPARIN